MASIWQDLKFSLRSLRRTPGVTVFTIATLAIGIGANTSIFSIINGMLLRPLPYSDPDRLVMVWEHEREKGIQKVTVSPPNFEDWHRRSRAFEDMAATLNWAPVLNLGSGSFRLSGRRVSINFFSTLGVEPAFGRVFSPSDASTGNDQVVILSHGCWQQHFGGEMEILGSEISLDGQSYTVVGVMHPTFRFPEYASNEQPQVMRPLALSTSNTSRKAHLLSVIARLESGVTLAQAREAMTLIARQLEAEYSRSNGGWGVTIVPLREEIIDDFDKILILLLAAGSFVLLIVCVNVGNIQLSRALSRETEIATRIAVGATRVHITRQVLIEA